MPSSIPSDPGTVVLVRIRFSNDSGTKRRPAVIVSVPEYHRAHADAIVVPLTTNPQPHFGDCKLGDWQAAGLPRPSTAKAFVQTVERSTFERALGSLSQRDLAGVQASIRTVLGL